MEKISEYTTTNTVGGLFIVSNLYNTDSKTGTIVIPGNVNALSENDLSNLEDITSISLPNSITRIPESVLSNCPNLKYVSGIPNGQWGLSTLNNITVKDNILVRVNTNASGEVEIAPTISTVFKDAFKDCTKVTSVVFPTTSITMCDKCFNNCGLTSVTVPSNVLLGEWCFINCPSLISATVENNVVGNDSLFNNCSNLESIVFTPRPTGNMDINLAMICPKLKSIVIKSTPYHTVYGHVSGDYDYDKIFIENGFPVEAMYSIALSCPSLETLTFEDTRADIRCNPLIAHNCPAADKDVIINGVFVNMATSSLYGTTPIGVTVICRAASYNVPSLKSYTIRDGVTEILSFAFARCPNLEFLKMPTTLTKIGYGMLFGQRSTPTVLDFRGVSSVPEIMYSSLYPDLTDYRNLGNVIIYVSSEEVKSKWISKYPSLSSCILVRTS